MREGSTINARRAAHGAAGRAIRRCPPSGDGGGAGWGDTNLKRIESDRLVTFPTNGFGLIARNKVRRTQVC